MDVMKQVRVRGPRKVRGLAAVAAKKRAVAAAAKAHEKRFVADKQNPFRPFTTYPREDMYEAMSDFVQNLDPAKQREVIRIFNILMSGVPWTDAQTFFQDFDQFESPNVVAFFTRFMKDPRVVEDIAKMKALIQRRQAQPLKARPDVTPQVQEGPRRAIVITPPGVSSSQAIAPKGRIGSEEPAQRIKPMFGEGRILSKCEREYGRAPWMAQFTDKPIRGFVIQDNDPRYTSSPYVITFRDFHFQEQQYHEKWYKVNMRWYKEACEGKREFEPDAVAYVTVDGELIVETPEMFDASLSDWTKIADVEFAPVTGASFNTAKTMLEDSILPAGDVNAVLASLVPITGSATNHDMARRLSWVLVFLGRLTKDPQVHHFRVKNHQIPPDTLVELDRYTLLPEIYKNPDADHDEAELILKKKRRAIESAFYAQLRPIDPTRRKRMSPARPEVFRPLDTNARAKCPKGVDDVIYYDENGELFCFSRDQVVGQRKNPVTGKPFNQDFIEEVLKIKAPVIASTRSQQQDIVIEREVERELAPGLFQKLKDEINLIRSLYCNQCDAEIFVPRFKSVKGNQKVMFCSQECFDQFDF